MHCVSSSFRTFGSSLSRLVCSDATFSLCSYKCKKVKILQLMMLPSHYLLQYFLRRHSKYSVVSRINISLLLQVRLEDTEWSYPIEITKEDTIFMVLRCENGSWRFLKTEIRGFEEGSRFIVVFRLGSTDGPIRQSCSILIYNIAFILTYNL